MSLEEYDHHMIARAVLGELCLSGMYAQMAISEVAKSCLMRGDKPEALRDEMITAWQEYQDPVYIFKTTKVERFFGDGIWRNKKNWQRKENQNGAFKGKTESTLDAAASLIEKIESSTAAGKAEYPATGEAGGSRPSRLLG